MALANNNFILPEDLNGIWDSVNLARTYTRVHTLDINDATITLRGLSAANREVIGVLPIMMPVDTYIEHVYLYIGATAAATVTLTVEGTFETFTRTITTSGGFPSTISPALPHRLMALAGSLVTITITEAPDVPVPIFRVHLGTRRRWSP
jgi:hypothetical protein